MTQKRRSTQVARIIKKDGRLSLVGMGKWYTYWRDPYHLLLTVPWLGFLAIVTLGYVLSNAFFASAYLFQAI